MRPAPGSNSTVSKAARWPLFKGLIRLAFAHDWPEAIRQFQEAIELCGNCAIKADLHKKLGLTECQMGDLDRSEKEVRLAQALKPADPDIERALERIAAVRRRQAEPHPGGEALISLKGTNMTNSLTRPNS